MATLGTFYSSEYPLIIFTSFFEILPPRNNYPEHEQETPGLFLTFIINFTLSNLYGIRIPYNLIIGNSKIDISKIKILPISNPKIGTSPEETTLSSIFEDEYLILLRDEGFETLLFFYEIDFKKAKNFEISQNILEIEMQKDTEYTTTIFEKRLNNTYITCIDFIPHFYGNKTYEHLLAYTTEDRRVYQQNITSKINIVGRTIYLASKQLAVYA